MGVDLTKIFQVKPSAYDLSAYATKADFKWGAFICGIDAQEQENNRALVFELVDQVFSILEQFADKEINYEALNHIRAIQNLALASAVADTPEDELMIYCTMDLYWLDEVPCIDISYEVCDPTSGRPDPESGSPEPSYDILQTLFCLQVPLYQTRMLTSIDLADMAEDSEDDEDAEDDRD